MKRNKKIIDASYKLMEMVTKGYNWYHDTPEQPFKYSKGTIWLINPETKEWILELRKSGYLWYYDKTYDTFSMYLNMELSDFDSFIKLWVEDVLKKGVVSTTRPNRSCRPRVEDVRKKGVFLTISGQDLNTVMVEDVLKKGVVTFILPKTILPETRWRRWVKNILKKGKQWN